MNNEPFELRIKALCKLKKISISDLESACNFSPGLISRWKTNSPSIDKVLAVARYLGVSVSTLLGEEKYEERTEPKPEKEKDILQQVIDRTKDGRFVWTSIEGRQCCDRVVDRVNEKGNIDNYAAYRCDNEKISYLLLIPRDAKELETSEIIMYSLLYGEHIFNNVRGGERLLELTSYVNRDTYEKAVYILGCKYETENFNAD